MLTEHILNYACEPNLGGAVKLTIYTGIVGSLSFLGSKVFKAGNPRQALIWGAASVALELTGNSFLKMANDRNLANNLIAKTIIAVSITVTANILGGVLPIALGYPMIAPWLITLALVISVSQVLFAAGKEYYKLNNAAVSI